MTHEQQNETLTPTQRKFVKEYPIDFNGTEAYMRASGTKNRKSAAVQASKLLKLPKIQEELEIYIEEQLGPQEKRFLENVKFWEDVRDTKLIEGLVVPMEEVVEVLREFGLDETEGLTEALREIPRYMLYAHKTADRMKASENLAKYSQMFVERTENEHNVNVTIVDDVK